MSNDEDDDISVTICTRSHKPPGYDYYQTFSVDLDVTYRKTYTQVRAMNEDHALAVAERRVKQFDKGQENQGNKFITAKGIKAKRIKDD